MLSKSSSRIIDYYLPIALFAFCFIFKFIFIDSRDIAIDEPFSLFHAQQDIKHITGLPTQGEPNTPLFPVLLHFWIKLFGYNAMLLRTLPLIFNSLTVIVIYKIGKRFFNLSTAITASLLYIFSFSHFFHGLELRSYPILVLAVTLSLYSYLNLIKTNKTSNIIWLLLSNLLLVYSHYFGWFIIFSESLGLLFLIKNRKAFLQILLSIGLTIIGYIPMIKTVYNQFLLSKKGTWLSPPSFSDYKKELLFILNDNSVLIAIGIIIALGILLFLYRSLKYRQWEIRFNVKYILLFFWSLIPFTLMFFISFKIPIFTGRYILYTSPVLYLLVSFTVAYLFKKYKFVQYGALAVLVITMAVSLRIFPHDFGYREIKNTAEFIKNTEKQLDNRVILIYPAWLDIELIYYYDLELFKSYDGFEKTCQDRRIQKAWSAQQIEMYSKQYVNNDIILLTNTGSEETELMNSIVDSSHVFIKKQHFPEFYNIGIYKAKK